ncbi:hypothetical protein GCM10010170_041940 [Dactylosporangium salmoneum]|uniref:Uncharacterized protein n=1 Tax=Dactylosporangium salmoneum TaxID=53361 RepID=A0ABP5THQ3_9ACTN
MTGGAGRPGQQRRIADEPRAERQYTGRADAAGADADRADRWLDAVQQELHLLAEAGEGRAGSAAAPAAGLPPAVAARLAQHAAAASTAAWHVRLTARADVVSCGVSVHASR